MRSTILRLKLRGSSDETFHGTLEAQVPIYWVPVPRSLFKFILSKLTQGPTIWVPGLLYGYLGFYGKVLFTGEPKVGRIHSGLGESFQGCWGRISGLGIFGLKV